jgi:hypothetical protein
MRRNAGSRRAGRASGVRQRSSDPLAAYLATIASLKAWFDPTSDAYFTFSTGAQISAWVSRLGSLGSVTLAQATSGNQPLRSSATASLGNKNTVQFDGTDDFLQASTASDWTFLHNNTGATIINVERIDSTGFATQVVYATCGNSAASTGMFNTFGGSLTNRVANGSGTFQNNWSIATAAHFARDVSRWRAWSYGGATAGSHVSGSSLTNADTGGQVPAVGAPTLAFTLGRSTVAGASWKGHSGDIIICGSVLSDTERNTIAGLLATKYTVSA